MALRGLGFVMIGSAAINAAWHARRSSRDLDTAFEMIIAAPMGRVLMGIVASGLMAFAIWCLLDAFLDASRKGTKPKGLAQRAAGVFVGCVYLGLSVLAIGLTLEFTQPGGPRIREWTAFLLWQPFGQWLAGAAGAIIITVGALQLGAAFRRGRQQTHRHRRALEGYGLASRGVLFLVVGGFMIVAAVFRAPAEARGLRGAFRFLGQQPFGLTLVCVIGVGLAVHGIMSGLETFRNHRRLAELAGDRVKSRYPA